MATTRPASRPKGAMTKRSRKRFSLAPLSKDGSIGTLVVRIRIKPGKSTEVELAKMATYFEVREVAPIYLDANLYAIHTEQSEQVIWARIKDEEATYKKVRNQVSRLGLHVECVGRGAEIPLNTIQVKGTQKIA